MSIAVSLGLLGLLASFGIAVLSLHSHASPSTTPSTPASTPADDKRWYSLGYVDIEGGITPLYPLQMGRVKSIAARENEPVKTGQPLFYLEDTVPQLKVQRAKAGVEEAQGQLKVAQSESDALDKKIAAQREAIEIAEIEVKRARALRDEKNNFSKKGIGPKFEAEDAEFLVKKAQQAVRGQQAQLTVLEMLKGKTAGSLVMAQANLKDKQTLLAEAENAVKECMIRAPVDGTPLRILVNVGETLGSNPHQPAIQFAAARPLLVRAEVEQEFVGRVHPDQNVVIEDHVTGKECGRGKVVSIAQWYAPRRTANPDIMTMNNDNRTLECIVHIESPSREIRIGQRVRVKFLD
ncbi:MAG TPA: biotin/lipoyl-binding protein [Gemmataceae bacterium]|nr:biotin/lipoyl-binding protein [Gemmataceae bacterium]